MNDRDRQVVIRRHSFEKHIRECGICETRAEEMGHPSMSLCLGGKIMLAHYVRAASLVKQ